ncbi:hypothetical protein ACIRL2_41445 [Embleya sp. NPDC127516]|uniref:hypothetical protein n=1 Tax=Embleya sp. NPDC127516 TaxID=3363990 RepID=UPI00381D72B0
MAIPMPDEQALPPGPRRDLVDGFHVLYRNAGRPGTRKMADAIRRDGSLPSTVAHETLAGLLHGRSVPDWPRLESAVRYLASVSVRGHDPEDIDVAVIAFHVLWNAERDAAPAPQAADTMTAAEWFEIALADRRYDEFGDATSPAVLEQAGLDPDEPLTLRTALLMLAHLERHRNAPAHRPSPWESVRRVSGGTPRPQSDHGTGRLRSEFFNDIVNGPVVGPDAFDPD